MILDSFSKFNPDKIEKLGQIYLKWSSDKKNDVVQRLWNEFNLDTSPLGFVNSNLTQDLVSSDEYRSFIDEFNARQHFIATLKHKKRIRQIYEKLTIHCLPPDLTKEMIRKHDDSKLTVFEEIVGYTIRDVWKVSSNLCSKAAEHHFLTNPHHPEYFTNKRSDLNENMNKVGLLESIVDKIALNWEHNYRNYSNPTSVMWKKLPEEYLENYTEFDKTMIKDILGTC